ncbi:elongation factor 1-gamma isoform X2 [Bombina bombina]|uniref:elongation factor 1-gamma isoform X2 n=1 Tax=Bombina bombina TaxID=8345 RepID=UPI00235AEC33|nr:elongation factor 1-gamma isoform X2 [Bombina bombina]
MKVCYYHGHWEILPILITAKHSVCDIELECHQGDETTVCPVSQPWQKPKLTDDGLILHGHQSILYYIAPDDLQGSAVKEKSLVQMWMHFVEKEIVPVLYAWVYPIMGRLPFNKQSTEHAKETCCKLLSALDAYLRTCTFLVGERLTLADIVVASALLWPYVMVFEPSFREPYVNLNRWFQTCVNFPAFTSVLGDVPLCKEAYQFKEGCPVKIFVPFGKPQE